MYYIRMQYLQINSYSTVIHTVKSQLLINIGNNNYNYTGQLPYRGQRTSLRVFPSYNYRAIRQTILPSPFLSQDGEKQSATVRKVKETISYEAVDKASDHYIQWILGNLGQSFSVHVRNKIFNWSLAFTFIELYNQTFYVVSKSIEY